MKVIFIVFIDFGHPKPSVKIVWGLFFPFQGYLYALYMKKK